MAKRAKLKEEDATAYIQAGALPDGTDDVSSAPQAISKEIKVLAPAATINARCQSDDRSHQHEIRKINNPDLHF